MDRRAFLMAALAGVLLDPRRAETQPPARVPHIGIVADPPHAPNLRLEAFRRQLRELGVEGRTIVLDVRRWDGTSGATPAIIAELIVNLKTARALGVTIPPSLLARTERVID